MEVNQDTPISSRDQTIADYVAERCGGIVTLRGEVEIEIRHDCFLRMLPGGMITLLGPSRGLDSKICQSITNMVETIEHAVKRTAGWPE